MSDKQKYEYDIPHEIVSLAKDKNDYLSRIESYFRLVHPGMKLIGIEGKKAVFKK